MPNSSYVGDQAAVLPDNTAALLHFSNMFAEMERQKRLNQLAQQKLDLARQKDISDYTGSKTNPKDYYANADYGTYVKNGLDNMNQNAQQMSEAGAPASAVKNYLNQAAADLSFKSQRVKQMQDNITSGVAALLKRYPNMDPSALLHFTAHDTYYDKDGNLVQPEQLDPTQPVVQQAFVRHYGDLFPAGSGATDLKTRLNAAKLLDKKSPTQFDKNGDITSVGYQTKLPDFATVGKDNKGNYVAQALSQNYRIPGSNHDYVDNNGQNVKVLPDNLFKQYYNGAIGANIDRQVNQDLKTPVQTDHGPVTFGPDSEYANMLRQKYLYQQLNSAASRYPVNMDPDANKNSLTLKNDIWRKEYEMANLNIRRQENDRSANRFQWEKDKEAGKIKEQPLTDYYEQNASKTLKFPLSDASMQYVDTKDIKPGDLNTITGNKYLADGTPDPQAITKNIQPFKRSDGSTYFIIKNGQWYGANGQIDMLGAYKRQTDAYNKVEKNKNIFQRAAGAIRGFVGNAPVIK